MMLFPFCRRALVIRFLQLGAIGALGAGALGCMGGMSEPSPTGASSSSSGGSSSGSATAKGSGSSGASSSGSGSSGATMAVGNTVDCADLSTTMGTLTEQFDGVELMASSTKSYFLQTNWWNLFSSETEDYNGLSFQVHNPQSAVVMANDNNPLGFPSIFVGQYAGHTTMGSNLPKQVSALTSVPTVYETNNSSIGTSNHNATYDVWFTQSSAPLPTMAVSPGAGGAYLMVWMFKPTDRQPRGKDAGHTGLTVNGVPGTWDVWIDTTNPPCVSYVSSTPIEGLQFDLNDFIQDAVTNQYGLTSSMYLSLVFGGFEIWGQADGMTLKSYCVNVK